MKRKIPELVLGALLATALWAVLAVVLSQSIPRLETSQPPKQGQTGERSSGKEAAVEKKGLIERTFEDPVALFTAVLTFFTGLLFVATCGLWYMAVRQARDMKDSIAVNKVSADAAKKSADVGERALTHLERPYLFLTYERPDFSSVGDGAMSFRVRFKFKNYGRTPAIIRHVCADVGRFERLPETLTYDAADSIFEMREMVVGPTDETEEFRRKIFALERDEANAVQAGKSFICLYGTLSYDDVFETRHGSEFCWIYDPHRNSFWRSERHNSET